LTPELAARLADIVLGHVTREYPNKLDHVMTGPADLRAPRDLHPIFYGSFDWHSCVHGYWSLARLYRVAGDLPFGTSVRALLDAQLDPEKVAAEVAYFKRPASRGFERPYGWAWLLMLGAELSLHETPEGKMWAARLGPLCEVVSDRFKAFLPIATYPVRAGAHTNTAFALALAFTYAKAAGDDDLRSLLEETARRWYGGDRDCQSWEPSGDDFLSPALIESECMRRILPASDHRAWLAGFLPRLSERSPATLFEPAIVSERSDGKIAHLDGLNLSRAWCWRGIAAAVEKADPLHGIAVDVAERHLEAALPHIEGDYMGEHWLASFVLLALTE
jgi:hypothetical protein